MSLDLETCPFCGGEAEIRHKERGVYIACKKCGSMTSVFNEYFNVNIRDYSVQQMKAGNVNSVCGIIMEASIKKAVEAWNRRCS